MITLLLTLLVLVVLWFATKTLFANHPPNVRLVIDLLFALVAVLIILRWAGLFVPGRL